MSVVRVRILLFAALADTAGVREMEVELPSGATVDDALDAAASRYDGIAAMRNTLAVAVDEAYAPRDTRLADGCTVALIPPVSGG